MRHPRATPAPSQPGKSVFYRMLADSGPFSWTSRCSLGAPVGLRHGDPAQRCLRGIPAWQTIPQPISKRFLSGVITALRHGNPCPQVPQRHPRAILLALSPRYPRIIPAWQIGLLPNVGRFGAFFMDIEVLIGCSSRSSARRPCLQVLHSHLRVAKQSSIGPSARRPCPEVSQRHPRVAKGLSIGSSARRPLPQPSQWHPRVANHPPTDLKTVSFRCHNRSSARRPCPQVLQSHPRVAKQSSIGPSARGPCLQAPQSHLHVAKRSSDRSLERPPRPQMPQWPPR